MNRSWSGFVVSVGTYFRLANHAWIRRWKQSNPTLAVCYVFILRLPLVQRINSRFNEYNTLTAWEGFDSLDENSDDDDIATPTTTKQAKIEPSTPVHPPPPTVPLSPVTTDIEPPPQAPSTPVKKAGECDTPRCAFNQELYLKMVH